MPDTFTIDDQEFTRRKVVRSVQIELEAVQDEISALADAMSGLQAEADHTGNALEGLARKEGNFDARERGKLLDKRGALRTETREMNTKIIEAQARALALRLDPQPGADWLLDHTDNDDFMAILEWLEERPTGALETGSETN